MLPFRSLVMPKLKIFLVANVILSAAVGGFLYFRGMERDAIAAALAVLIAFSPFNYILGLTLILKRAARLVGSIGVRMRSSDALIRLSAVDTAAFSMNRMLTTGKYFITDLIPEGLTQDGLLAIAASAERNSTHPLGRKIFETAEARGLRLNNAPMFNEFAGNGVEALINGTAIRVGRPAWIKSEGIKISMELRTKVDQVAAKSRTPLIVSMGQTARGLIGMKDEPDDRATIFLDRLKYNGLTTVMLTAEPKKKAQVLSKGLEIDVVRSDLLPEDKAREIQLMQARGRTVAMISSDEHDDPAFKVADASVMISDVDTSRADFVIGAMEQFFELLKIAARTKKILRMHRRIVIGTLAVPIPILVKMIVDAGSMAHAPVFATVGVLIGAGLIVWNSRQLVGNVTEHQQEL